MNYLTIAGHLGSDPEVRFTSSGQKVTTLRVACRARKDETIWWKVTVWGEQFDKMIQYLKKGSPVISRGEMQKPEIFNDREGKPQVSMQMTAHHLGFSPFGKPKTTEEGGQAGGSMNQFAKANTENPFQEAAATKPAGESFQDSGFTDDEIPF